MGTARATSFIATQEHRRFTEFADAVRKHRYIGLCHGPAGVGKTLSARRYAHWDVAAETVEEWGRRKPDEAKVNAHLARSRAVFFTPTVSCSLRELRHDVPALIDRADICIDDHVRPYVEGKCKIIDHTTRYVELLIVDEAERLTTTALEWLRDLFDRRGIGLILIGMPGIDKRMARYPQLFSRVGFAHHYRPLQDQELTFVLTRRWRDLGLSLDDADFTDAQAVAAIVRMTGGNFRLLHRLFVQTERILPLNELTVITEDVVEAARSTLVIGVT